MLCRPLPSGDLRRDLIDAWPSASTEKCPPTIRLSGFQPKGAGDDRDRSGHHKRSHTVAALDAATGGTLAERTVSARQPSFDVLLAWARGHGAERVWAIEDCRHVSGALERFLLARGEAVVRIAPKLTVSARKAARESGKSDAIDAVAIARAALREGLDTLPVAHLAGPELDVRLLVDHPSGSSPSGPR